MGRKIRALRKLAADMPMSLQETMDAAAPLTGIVKEEDEKGRGKWRWDAIVMGSNNRHILCAA